MWNDEETEDSGRVCSDCSAKAPPDAGEHTLISVKYGWRLTRETNAAGEAELVWRCPACSQKNKEARSSGPPSRPRPADSEKPPTSYERIKAGLGFQRKKTSEE